MSAIRTHLLGRNLNHPDPTEKTSALAAARKSRYYSKLYTEIADRELTEIFLRHTNSLLNALSEAQLRYLSNTNLSDVLTILVDRILELTGSEYGVIGEVEVSEDRVDQFKILASSHSWATDSVEFKARLAPLYKVIETGKPLIVDAEETPSGPHRLSDAGAGADIGLPLLTGKSVVGAIGLANRPGGFDKGVITFLQPLLSACAQLIVAEQNDQRRKQAEQELAEERVSLAQRVADRTEKLRTANSELSRAARAKDEFLATMNHELRTPLNAILLLSEVLQEQIYGPLNEKQLRSLRSVEESGRHLLSLISDILDFVKMNAGKLKPDIATISVESVCESSLQLVSAMAQKKGVHVSKMVDEGVVSLNADDRHLKQMLVNLLSNAIKFTNCGGEVGLAVSGDSGKDEVYFLVWDTGIGIADEDMPKLFQPFAQIDSSNSRQYEGSGLGLVLVSRMAELQGGTVSIQSEVGKGSRFTITLPWQGLGNDSASMHNGNHSDADVDADYDFDLNLDLDVDQIIPFRQAPPVPAPAMPEVRGELAVANHDQTDNADSRAEPCLILLAEDNEANIDALSGYLLSQNYGLVVAHNGKEAIEKARSERPDLILMDVQMPEMDGVEATRHIRADPDLSDIPIIALTALVMPGDRARCHEAGVDDYVSKPVSLRALNQAIAGQLPSSRLQVAGHRTFTRSYPDIRHRSEIVEDAPVNGDAVKSAWRQVS